MPQRLLRPGITTSRRFNALDWQGQSFYVRLLTIVDDYGRCEADTSLLASLCFPMYRDCPQGADICQRVAGICQQMSAEGMAIFYESDGTKYLQLTRWKERTRSESRHPAPPADICQQMSDNVRQMIASPPQPQPQPSSSLPGLQMPAAPKKLPVRATREELVGYCLKDGLLESDGNWLFDHWEGNGWTNQGKPIKSWRHTIAAWKTSNYLPSLKTNRRNPTGSPL